MCKNFRLYNILVLYSRSCYGECEMKITLLLYKTAFIASANLTSTQLANMASIPRLSWTDSATFIGLIPRLHAVGMTAVYLLYGHPQTVLGNWMLQHMGRKVVGYGVIFNHSPSPFWPASSACVMIDSSLRKRYTVATWCTKCTPRFLYCLQGGSDINSNVQSTVPAST